VKNIQDPETSEGAFRLYAECIYL